MGILRLSLGLRALRKDPLAFLRGVAARGDLIRIGPALSPVFVVNHPILIRHVLHENHANYHKGAATTRVRPLFGDGLTTADDEPWREHRRLLLPLFQTARVQGFSPTVAEATAELADRWRDLAAGGRLVDIGAEMLALTRRIILRVLFDKIEALQEATLSAAMVDAPQEVNRRVWSALPPPLWIPTPRNRRLRHALQTLQAFVQARTEDPCRPRGDSVPWLDALLTLEDGLLDDGWIRDETLTVAPGPCTATRSSGRNPNASTRSASPPRSGTGAPPTPTFPSAAARASASARDSPSWRCCSSWRHSPAATECGSSPPPPSFRSRPSSCARPPVPSYGSSPGKTERRATSANMKRVGLGTEMNEDSIDFRDLKWSKAEKEPVFRAADRVQAPSRRRVAHGS